MLVPDVGHGALVRLGVAGRERVLAAGDDVFGAHGQLPAPWRAPGQADIQAFPAAGAVGRIDHAADDVGAENGCKAPSV